MTRGFEIVTKYENENIELPARSTAKAAGYDFKSAVDFTVPSDGNIVLIPTGIKAFMNENEYLALINRSSGPIKLGLVMPNAVGVVDADYYNNDSNEGEIFFQMMSISGKDVEIKKGDRIGQGIFTPFLIADEDNAAGIRTGGFGSTGKN